MGEDGDDDATICVPDLHIWSVQITEGTPGEPEKKKEIEVTTGPAGPFSADLGSSPSSSPPHCAPSPQEPSATDPVE